jgi:hypothetical protein
MTSKNLGKPIVFPFIAAVVLALVLANGAYAQPPGFKPPPPKTAKDAAPIDLTGYWVSVVSEDWRFRMVMPPKGDYPNIPLNGDGRKVADSWNPTQDPPDSCKAYGAPNIMRQPGRLHITWTNDTTLKIDTDAGIQTRLLRFGAVQPIGESQWQGFSIAQWEGGAPAFGFGPPGAGSGPRGSLKVVTTRIRPGYLQANGVPYSGDTVMTEYFDVVKESNGDQWLVVKSIVEDKRYLMRSFIRSTHFKKQADAAGWNPMPCR